MAQIGMSKEERKKRFIQSRKNFRGTKVLPDPEGNPFLISALNSANKFLDSRRTSLPQKTIRKGLERLRQQRVTDSQRVIVGATKKLSKLKER